MNIKDFKLNQVIIKDEYYTNALEKEIAYLKAFNADRLVAGFREVNSMRPKGEKYPGWEVTEIRGHSLGHYMTAVAQAVAQTGDVELRDKLTYIVSELKKSQLKNGYLSAFEETLFDNVENKKPCWVPWYTMDKIISGLVASYKLCDIKEAYEVVKRLGDWVYNRTKKWTKEIQDTVLNVEYGGMNEAMYELYSITNDENHDFAAHMFDEIILFEEIEKGNDILNGKHANTTIPKFLGALYRYIKRGYKEEDKFYFDAAERFFDIVNENHTYITGGNSEWEHFGESRILDAERTNCNCETCNTYNMLKLARELFKITGNKKYSDFYENTFLNAIMSSQNPETGMTMYFQPMATGYFKVYSTPFDSFWCCTGTGMENFTKCNDSIYFYEGNTVFVNQYISSELNWEENGFLMEQKSFIPNAENTVFKIKSSNNTELAVRIPSWAESGIEVKIDGKSVSDYIIKEGYIYISTKENMEIEFIFKMSIKAYSLPDNKNCIALKYGPVVLSAALGTEDLEESKTGVDVTIATKNINIKDFITVKNQDGSEGLESDVENWILNIKDNVSKKDGELVFNLKNTDSDDILFVPHYSQHKERYGIYWNIVSKDSKALQNHIYMAKEKERLLKVAIDSIPLGNDQYELLHNIKGENTGAGTYNGMMLRHAWSEKGWFSYDMKVNPEVSNYLLVKYFSGNEGRTFNIYVDDKILIEETIKNKIPGEFYDEYYKIPDEWIKNKESINVKFLVRGDSWVGGIFDKLSIVSDYDKNPMIKNLIINGGKLDKIYEETVTEYALTPDVNNDKVSITFGLTNQNGLIYVNGVLIDDTVERVIDIKKDREIKIESFAEDFTTKKDYNIKVLG